MVKGWEHNMDKSCECCEKALGLWYRQELNAWLCYRCFTNTRAGSINSDDIEWAIYKIHSRNMILADHIIIDKKEVGNLRHYGCRHEIP